ncbi:hypothetical protein WICPIJ_009808 [Wickerhamomyces pijperi]|uniref:Uncharacterized protein n=1 Tax=Wickerhamomyces pijperi TaxID=599730 RepID=A0A9P8PKX2_WICPI|nr:hypothetical protein WICPIJ_009808 [Wickerhamomyces pijperi]
MVFLPLPLCFMEPSLDKARWMARFEVGMVNSSGISSPSKSWFFLLIWMKSSLSSSSSSSPPLRLQLRLDGGLSSLLDVQSVHLDLLGRQSLEEGLFFRRSQHQHGLTGLTESGRTANSVNVGVDIFRSIDLDNPFNGWEVQPSGNHICGEKNRVLGFGELVHGLCSGSLLLTAMKLHQCDTRLQLSHGLVGEMDLLGRRKENQGLSLQVGSDETTAPSAPTSSLSLTPIYLGSTKLNLAKSLTDLDWVAEKSNVCLSSVGKLDKMSSKVFLNPISKHLSASSNTRTCKFDRSKPTASSKC